MAYGCASLYFEHSQPVWTRRNLNPSDRSSSSGAGRINDCHVFCCAESECKHCAVYEDGEKWHSLCEHIQNSLAVAFKGYDVKSIRMGCIRIYCADLCNYLFQEISRRGNKGTVGIWSSHTEGNIWTFQSEICDWQGKCIERRACGTD